MMNGPRKSIVTICQQSLMLVLLSVIVAWVQSTVSAEERTLILATTTSTQDSGLLDVLIPRFEKKTGYQVKTIAVGTGQALKMGERGDADVLLVHAPEAELKFMQAGHGSGRRLVMHNDFIIVGPTRDPARIQAARSITEAFKRLAAGTAPFISRGDESGTHKMEQKIWSLAKIAPSGSWYLQTGQGMGATLTIASEKNGYTLTDRGTYLALHNNLHLKVLFQKDPILLNIYHVIEVNPKRHPNVNVSGAKALADFLVAKDTQRLIGKFGVDKFGQPLFFPDAGKGDRVSGVTR